MEHHKRLLGILFIISGVLQILLFVFLSVLFSVIFEYMLTEVNTDERWVVEMVMNIAKFLPAVIITCIAVPSIIGGIGLINHKSWALVLALVLGCLKLFSFPFGTALGIYTLWVYFQEQSKEKS